MATRITLQAFAEAAADPAKSAYLGSLLKNLFYFGPGAQPSLTAVAFHGLQIFWLAAAILVLMRRREALGSTAAWMLVPLLYLAAQFWYLPEVIVYYPRHIMSFHLALGVAAIVAARDLRSPVRLRLRC